MCLYLSSNLNSFKRKQNHCPINFHCNCIMKMLRLLTSISIYHLRVHLPLLLGFVPVCSSFGHNSMPPQKRKHRKLKKVVATLCCFFGNICIHNLCTFSMCVFSYFRARLSRFPFHSNYPQCREYKDGKRRALQLAKI